MFTAETYSNRRKGLISQLKHGLVILVGNDPSPVNFPDQHYPFRQDSNFLYYFGIDRPGLIGVMDIEAGEAMLFGEDATLDEIVWTGPQPTLEAQGQTVGITHTQEPRQFLKMLRQARGQQRPIHFLPPYRSENLLKLHHWLEMPLERIRTGASVDLIRAIVAQRSIKAPEEIAEMHRAVDLSARMHAAARAACVPGKTEADVMADVYARALEGGHPPAYGIICSVRGEVLHNHHYHNTLEAGQLLLLDAGGESPLHYAGDITRTLPVGGPLSIRQKEIYQLVHKALTTSAAALKPGIPYRDVHLLACKVITDGLIDLGLMQGDAEEAVAAGAHALFFPHGLGHMIGLDVHDMEDLGENYVGYDEEIQRSVQFGLRSLRLGRRLQAGFALTIEPGIYFISDLIDRWQAEGLHTDFIRYDRLEPYRDFGGIRLEDNYYLTPNGAELLGAPIPFADAHM